MVVFILDGIILVRVVIFVFVIYIKYLVVYFYVRCFIFILRFFLKFVVGIIYFLKVRKFDDFGGVDDFLEERKELVFFVL